MPRARRQPQPGLPTRCPPKPCSPCPNSTACCRCPDGPAHFRRKREGATQFPTIGLFERNANNFKGARNTKAQKSWSSRAEPEVRIHLPPAESRADILEHDLRLFALLGRGWSWGDLANKGAPPRRLKVQCQPKGVGQTDALSGGRSRGDRRLLPGAAGKLQGAGAARFSHGGTAPAHAYGQDP